MQLLDWEFNLLALWFTDSCMCSCHRVSDWWPCCMSSQYRWAFASLRLISSVLCGHISSQTSNNVLRVRQRQNDSISVGLQPAKVPCLSWAVSSCYWDSHCYNLSDRYSVLSKTGSRIHVFFGWKVKAEVDFCTVLCCQICSLYSQFAVTYLSLSKCNNLYENKKYSASTI